MQLNGNQFRERVLQITKFVPGPSLQEYLKVFAAFCKDLIEASRRELSTPCPFLDPSDEEDEDDSYSSDLGEQVEKPATPTEEKKKPDREKGSSSDDQVHLIPGTCKRKITKRAKNNTKKKHSDVPTKKRDNTEAMDESPIPSTSATAATARNTVAANTPVDSDPVKGSQNIKKTHTDSKRPQKELKIPPVVLRSPTNWAELNRTLKKMGINIGSAKVVSDTIKMQPETINDFRQVTKLLEDNKLEYHTYQLPEEKTLKVVIKGINANTPEEDIKEDLIQQNLPVIKVHRMRSGYKKRPLPQVMVELNRNEAGKKIFNIRTVHCLNVTVETLRRRNEVPQCYRCQGYWHAANCCRATPKCVSCGKEHLSSECTLPKANKPHCAQCSGHHPANYRGCPAFPKLCNKNKEKQEPKPAIITKTAERHQGISYSQAVKETGAVTTSSAPKLQQAKSNAGKYTQVTKPANKDTEVKIALLHKLDDLGKTIAEIIKLLE